MKLLKIILLFALIYFIRQFIRMYRMMKVIQEDKMNQTPKGPSHKSETPHENVVDADFKVMDP